MTLVCEFKNILLKSHSKLSLIDSFLKIILNVILRKDSLMNDSLSKIFLNVENSSVYK